MFLRWKEAKYSLISTNLAIFGFFPSKKHDSVGIRNFQLKLLDKNHKKIENNDNK